MTMLWGTTSVGTGSVVGPNSRLTDCTVAAERCTVDETVAIQAAIDNDVDVRAARVPAPGHAHVRRFQGGHARRDQEVDGRAGQQGPASVLHRRRDHRQRRQYRRGDRSPATTTAPARTRRRLATTASSAADTMLVAPVTSVGANVVTRRGKLHHERRARRGAHAGAQRAEDRSRAGLPDT